jgi:acid stress-induced BolA-like protein IbaG/YrbA
MDLEEKVKRALDSAIELDHTILVDDDGLIGYVVSPDFRGQDSLARQGIIFDALRASGSPLTTEEVQRVIAVVAFTPEEFDVLGPELPDLTPLRS